jgi:hypothetical protein
MSFTRLAALCALLLAACDSPSEKPDCDELEKYLVARERALQVSCVTDLDCAVVYIRPDRPIAASEIPTDPGLSTVLDAWYGRPVTGDLEIPESSIDGSGDPAGSGDGSGGSAEGSAEGAAEGSGGSGDASGSGAGGSTVAPAPNACAPLPVETNRRLFAVCVEVRDVVSASGLDEGSGALLGRQCVLRGDVEVDDGSGDGSGEGSGEQPCACSGCSPLEVCADCSCISVATRCGQACVRAWQCGELESLGLGTSAEQCVRACGAQSEVNPATSGIAACIADAACDDIGGCFVSDAP